MVCSENDVSGFQPFHVLPSWTWASGPGWYVVGPLALGRLPHSDTQFAL